MFVTIDDKPISKFCIQSFYSKDVTEDDVTSYNIIYYLVSGVVLIESFNSDSDRSVKLNFLKGD